MAGTLDFAQVSEIYIPDGEVKRITDIRTGNILWDKERAPIPIHDYSNDYFFVENLSNQNGTLTIGRSATSGTPNITVYKSTDQVNWELMGTTTQVITATVPANGKLYLKATADQWGTSRALYKTIYCNVPYNVGGNIMSLLYGDNFRGQTSFPTTNGYEFNGLFYSSQNLFLISAENLILPVTTLNEYSYAQMFYQNSNLEKAPVIYAKVLNTRSCYEMFSGDTELVELISYVETNNNDGDEGWLDYIKTEGHFYNLGYCNFTTKSNLGYGVPPNWVVSYELNGKHDYSNDYFFVEDVSGLGSTLTIFCDGNDYFPNITVYKSTDQVNWELMGTTSYMMSITATVPAKGKLYLKANTDAWGINYTGIPKGYHILCDQLYAVGGNIMSLLYGDNFRGQTSFPTGSSYNFSTLFYNNNYNYNYNTTLVSARRLVIPVTTLTEGALYNIFYNCTNLNDMSLYGDDISATNSMYSYNYNVATNCKYYIYGNADFTVQSTYLRFPTKPAVYLYIPCYGKKTIQFASSIQSKCYIKCNSSYSVQTSGSFYTPLSGNNTLEIYVVLKSNTLNVRDIASYQTYLKYFAINENVTNITVNSDTKWYNYADVLGTNPVYKGIGNGIIRKSDNTLVVAGAKTVISPIVSKFGDYLYYSYKYRASTSTAYETTSAGDYTKFVIPATVREIGSWCFDSPKCSDCYIYANVNILRYDNTSGQYQDSDGVLYYLSSSYTGGGSFPYNYNFLKPTNFSSVCYNLSPYSLAQYRLLNT